MKKGHRFIIIVVIIIILLSVTKTVNAASFSRNLYYGLRNNQEVRTLQQFLTESGFYNGPVTGNFFSLTRDAVRRFQIAYGVSPTGFFGPLSREMVRRIPLSTSGTSITPITPTQPTPTKPPVTTAPVQTPTPLPSNITTAPTPYPGCIQMDATGNNLSESRINIVFVGINYASVNDFAEVVKLAADVRAEKNGFFSIEPFLSNRDKFNIFYVTNIVSIPEETTFVPVNDEIYSILRNSVTTCGYQNRFGFVLINTSKKLRHPNLSVDVLGTANIFATSVPPERGSISVFPYPDADAVLSSQSVLVHEAGGHDIGNLFDEYVVATWLPDPTERNETYPTLKNQCYIVNPNALSCQLNSGYYSCNFGANPAAENGCLQNAEWRDIIGNGCGRDGVVDCTERDPDYAKEVRCWTNKCSVNSFGSVRHDSIMSKIGHRVTIVGDYNYTGKPFFGAQDERLICRRIKDLTGSVGGICNSLCLSGCQNGQYCSAGVCRSRQ